MRGGLLSRIFCELCLPAGSLRLAIHRYIGGSTTRANIRGILVRASVIHVYPLCFSMGSIPEYYLCDSHLYHLLSSESLWTMLNGDCLVPEIIQGCRVLLPELNSYCILCDNVRQFIALYSGMPLDLDEVNRDSVTDPPHCVPVTL